MKIAEIEIGGVTYPAALPLQVMANLEERSGKNAGEALDAILGADTLSVKDLCWLLAQMLQAGAALTKFKEPIPTETDLLNKYGLDDLTWLAASVLSSVRTSKPRIRLESIETAQKKTGLRAALRTLFG